MNKLVELSSCPDCGAPPSTEALIGCIKCGAPLEVRELQAPEDVGEVLGNAAAMLHAHSERLRRDEVVDEAVQFPMDLKAKLRALAARFAQQAARIEELEREVGELPVTPEHLARCQSCRDRYKDCKTCAAIEAWGPKLAGMRQIEAAAEEVRDD